MPVPPPAGATAVRRDPLAGLDTTEVPGWVLDGGSLVAAIARIREDSTIPRSVEEDGGNPIYVESRRNRAAAVAWCAERGLSYSRVQGSRWPTEEERASGYTRGAGPKFARIVEWCRLNGLGDTP